MPDLPPDTAARIYRGEATFADTVIAVGLQEAWGAERGRIVGSLDKIAEALKTSKESLRASLKSIEFELERLTCNDFKVAHATFSAHKSRIRRAIRLVDIHSTQRLSESLLSGEWRNLIEMVKSKLHPKWKSNRGDSAKIWKLVEYCFRRGIEPTEVCDKTIQDLVTDLQARGIQDPFSDARDIVYAWHRLQERFPALPQNGLSRLYRPGYGRPYDLGFEDLPTPFRSDWEGFKAQYGNFGASASLAELVPDAEDDLDRAHARNKKRSGRRFSKKELSNLRTTLTYAANHLILRGIEPIQIVDVLTPDTLDGVIRMMRVNQKEREKRGGPEYSDKHNSTRNAASLFIALSRIYGIPKEMIDDMVDTRDAVDPKVISADRDEDGKVRRKSKKSLIGPRHYKRLKQFNDSLTLLRWYDVLRILWERCEAVVRSKRVPKPEDINDMIVAVLHAITRCCPLRRENLAALRLDGSGASLTLPPNGKGRGYIFIPGAMTKNKDDIHVELTPEAVAMIRFYIEHFRPALMRAVGADPANPYLFPMRGTDHRSGELLNRHFRERNWKYGRFVLNVHCQRHLCAKIILDQDVTKMALVQQLLDHKSIEVTQAYYAEVNKIFAQRVFHAMLESKRLELIKELRLEGF